MTLVERLYSELQQFVDYSDNSYSNLEGLLGPEGSSQSLAKLKKARSVIRDIKVNFEQLPDSQGFSLNSINFLHNIYTKLEQRMPDSSQALKIHEDLKDEISNSIGGKIYNLVKMTPLVPVISGSVGALGSLYIGEPIAASIYAASAIFGTKLFLSKDYSFLGSTIANMGVILGSFCLGVTNEISLGSDEANIKGLLQVVPNNVSNLIITSLVAHKFAEATGHFKASKIHETNLDFSRLLKTGIAIKEARSNLKYVNNVSNSNNLNSDYFELEVRELERQLLRYVDGEVSYDEVLDSRIKYSPEPFQRVQKPSRVSVTDDERKIVRIFKSSSPKIQSSKRRKKRKLNTFDESETLSTPSDQFDLSISRSDSLSQSYEENSFKIGYSMIDLIDLTTSRILDRGLMDRPIQKDSRGMAVRKAMIKKHRLSEKANIYKMKHAGGMRALYTRLPNPEDPNTPEIMLLDILTHPEYMDLMKSKN